MHDFHSGFNNILIILSDYDPVLFTKSFVIIKSLLLNNVMQTICLTGITFFITDLVVFYRLLFSLWNVAVQYCSLCLTHHMFLPPSSPRPSGVKSNMDNTKDKLPSPAEKVL